MGEEGVVTEPDGRGIAQGAIRILYEDEDLLVVDKPPGQCMHPTVHHPRWTLMDAVLAYWAARGETRAFHPVTRLDVGTSGATLIAKSPAAHAQLARLQAAGAVRKTYLACVEGRVPRSSGVIDAPIGRVPGSIIQRAVRRDGQPACTRYRVAVRYAAGTLLISRPLTGRTHQIRVHLAHLGHPLFGDDLYGGARTAIARPALHAWRLAFPHPRTGELVRLTAPLPEDFRRLLERLADPFSSPCGG